MHFVTPFHSETSGTPAAPGVTGGVRVEMEKTFLPSAWRPPQLSGGSGEEAYPSGFLLIECD